MAEQKRLYRSVEERVIGGVAGGIGRYLAIDPVYVRLAFVVLSLFNGMGVLIYFIMWLLLPVEGSTLPAGEEVIKSNLEDMRRQAQRFGFSRGGSGAAIGGLVLVVLGMVFLLREFFPALPEGLLWPILLIAAGAYLVVARR